MHILHLSALEVWGQGKSSGMPSLYNNLYHYGLAGHTQTLLLPEVHMTHNGRGVGSKVQDHVRVDIPAKIERIPMLGMPTALLIRSRLSKHLGSGLGKYISESAGADMAWLILTVSFVLRSLALGRTKVFDVVYAHNSYTSLAGYCVGRLLGIPNITRLYGTFLARMIGKPCLPLRYPIMCSSFLIPSDLLVVTNDGTKGDLVAKHFHVGPERLRFWPNGISVEESRPIERRKELPFPVKKPLVLSLYRHVSWKRLDRLIRAIPLIKERVRDCQIIIGGTGPLTSDLKKLAQELGVAEAITWAGALSREQVWHLLREATVLVSTNDLTNRCNPVIEAITAGCPVVSMDDGSTGDLLRHEFNSLLVKPDGTYALAEAVSQVLEDVQLRARLRAGAEETAKTSIWSWSERMSKEIDEVASLVKASRLNGRAKRRTPANSSQRSLS